MIPQIPVEVYDKIVALCKKHKVRELSLFGSRVRGDFTEQSDYDFLVEFLPNSHVSLFDFSRMRIDLEDILHTPVDLVDKGGLRPSFTKRVLSEAKLIYAD